VYLFPLEKLALHNLPSFEIGNYQGLMIHKKKNIFDHNHHVHGYVLFFLLQKEKKTK